MAETKVICPNCGIIKRIEMACMWLGRPPMPEIENAFCPKCGAKTVIERDKESTSMSWNYNKKNDNDYKKREIDYYRDKYKKEFGLE
jgi:predicted RNA-binding Zn-ribbon protein involved in translation (DUF1610 family)